MQYYLYQDDHTEATSLYRQHKTAMKRAIEHNLDIGSISNKKICTCDNIDNLLYSTMETRSCKNATVQVTEQEITREMQKMKMHSTILPPRRRRSQPSEQRKTNRMWLSSCGATRKNRSVQVDGKDLRRESKISRSPCSKPKEVTPRYTYSESKRLGMARASEQCHVKCTGPRDSEPHGTSSNSLDSDAREVLYTHTQPCTPRESNKRSPPCVSTDSPTSHSELRTTYVPSDSVETKRTCRDFKPTMGKSKSTDSVSKLEMYTESEQFEGICNVKSESGSLETLVIPSDSNGRECIQKEEHQRKQYTPSEAPCRTSHTCEATRRVLFKCNLRPRLESPVGSPCKKKLKRKLWGESTDNSTQTERTRTCKSAVSIEKSMSVILQEECSPSSDTPPRPVKSSSICSDRAATPPALVCVANRISRPSAPVSSTNSCTSTPPPAPAVKIKYSNEANQRTSSTLLQQKASRSPAKVTTNPQPRISLQQNTSFCCEEVQLNTESKSERKLKTVSDTESKSSKTSVPKRSVTKTKTPRNEITVKKSTNGTGCSTRNRISPCPYSHATAQDSCRSSSIPSTTSCSTVHSGREMVHYERRCISPERCKCTQTSCRGVLLMRRRRQRFCKFVCRVWVLFKLFELALLALCIALATLFALNNKSMGLLTIGVMLASWAALGLATIITVFVILYGYHKRTPSILVFVVISTISAMNFGFFGVFLLTAFHGNLISILAHSALIMLTCVYLLDWTCSHCNEREYRR